MMDEVIPTILADLRAKLHQRVEFEVKDVENRICQELKQLNTEAIAGCNADAVVEVEACHEANQGETMEAMEAMEAPEVSVMLSMSRESREPSKDEFKAMVQRQSSYAYAWAHGSRVQYNRNSQSLGTLMQSGSESCINRITGLANSPYFDLFWALLIFSNAAFLGIQLTVAREVNLVVIHLAYAVLFAVELFLRLLALGPRAYFFAPGWSWNVLDVVVVSFSWVNIILEALGSSSDTGVSSSIRVLRLLRVSRLLRIVKTLWIVRFVGALRTLVSSLLDTLKPLFWAMLLLLLIMYIAGVLFTDVVLEHTKQNPDRNMERFFGHLGSSVQTLFRSISGGFDWGDAADALRPLGEFWVLLFELFVGFCTFAVLNVMTGFFCESAIKSAQKDHENTMDSRQEFRTLLTDIFNRLDDGDGQLTLAEFEKMFENEQMQAFLETAEITAADAWTLFASLDVDGDHVIDVDEFTKRCLTLRGGARSMDVFALTRQNLKIREQLNLVQQQLADLIVSVTLVDQRDIVSM